MMSLSFSFLNMLVPPSSSAKGWAERSNSRVKSRAISPRKNSTGVWYGIPTLWAKLRSLQLKSLGTAVPPFSRAVRPPASPLKMLSRKLISWSMSLLSSQSSFHMPVRGFLNLSFPVAAYKVSGKSKLLRTALHFCLNVTTRFLRLLGAFDFGSWCNASPPWLVKTTMRYLVSSHALEENLALWKCRPSHIPFLVIEISQLSRYGAVPPFPVAGFISMLLARAAGDQCRVLGVNT